MIIQILVLIVGFVLLIKGADIFVEGASSTARNFNVSKVVIGLTIVAFGTSAPELAISIKSMVGGNGEMLLGNVIGSNIVNTLLILGVSSLLCNMKVSGNTVRKEIPITLMLTLLMIILFIDNLFDPSMTNMISQSDGFVLLLFFMIFIYYLFSVIRNKTEADDPNTLEDNPSYPLHQSLLYTLIGLVGIILGSNFVVDSASFIASSLGVTERMIGLTIVAIGTSLPELVTSIMAARKKEPGLIIGNIVGSNIFNIGIVLGLPVALFGGISGIGFSYVDLILFFVSAIMLFICASNDRKINKPEGVIMLFTFIAYYAYVIIG